MPHYKDGTQAQVGDHVRGKPYNTAHEVAAVVVSITAEAESCNMVVAFLVTQPAALMGLWTPCLAYRPADHGQKGDPQYYGMRVDYAAVNEFTLIARP